MSRSADDRLLVELFKADNTQLLYISTCIAMYNIIIFYLFIQDDQSNKKQKIKPNVSKKQKKKNKAKDIPVSIG